MALYKDGNPVSGLNSIPRLTLAQYNAQNVKPEFWVRTDAPESYKKLSADQVSYDSNNTVKDMLDYALVATTHGNLVKIGHLRFFLVDLGLTALQNNTTYAWNSEIPAEDSPSITTLFGQALDSNSNVKLNISGDISSNGALIFRTSNGVDGQYYLRMWAFWVV